MASSRPSETESRRVDENPERVPDMLLPLWVRARPSMLQRVKALARATQELESGGGGLAPETREEAVREAHKLAGSLGTYGLMSGSRIAREIELRLEMGTEGDEGPVDARWLRSRVESIEALLEGNDTEKVTDDGVDGDDADDADEGDGGYDGDDVNGRDEGLGESVPVRTRHLPESQATQVVAEVATREAAAEGDPEVVRVEWDPETFQAEKGTRASPSMAVASSKDPAGPGAGPSARPALARLLRRVVQELEDVEAVVASSIRLAGRHKGDPQTSLQRQEAAYQLETVAGWLEEVGIDLPARRARELSRRLQGELQNVEVTRVAQDLLTLGRLLERLDSEEEAVQDSRILVVSPDRVWAQKIKTALEVMGHRVEARPPGRSTVPSDVAGIVVDGGPGSFDGFSVFGGAALPVPVLYAVQAPDTRKRVEAGRLGADRVMDRDVPARDLCGVLSDLLLVSGATTGRVLLVDDDETVLQAVEATMRHAGYEVTTVQGPEGFWKALEQTSPDLVITDLDMPGLDGAELTLAMRTDARWVNLPVVFLSSKDDHSSLRRVFEAGADDFVPKPLRPELLLSRVRARLSRLRSRSATGHLDPVTRLPVGAAFEHALDDLVQSADQARRNLFVAVLRLDASSLLRDRLGLMGLEREEVRLARLIEGHVESPAMAGRRESDRFVVVLPGVDLHDASALVGRIVEGFQSAPEERDPGPRVTVSAGVAQCGVHGRRTVELVAAAEAARLRAEEAGGSKVFLAGENAASRRLEKVDVLVVDDDPTIGELLLETLAQKGWLVVWEPDSERAVKRLTGPEQDLRARVVLLDVNMPGMDGLTVLRLLRENQVVPPTRVVMLTVRAREDEVVRALNMGASDHVAKPFSVPVLTTRVQRALGETT